MKLEGRTVAVIGNGPGVLAREAGDRLEACDLVCRFNDFRTDGFERYVGSRTDLWVCHASSMHLKAMDRFPAVLLANPSPNHDHHRRVVTRFLRRALSAGAAPLFVDLDTVANLRRFTGVLPAASHPSTGLIALYWLLGQGARPLVHGFDNFSAARHHYGDGEKFRRGKWHSPFAERVAFWKLLHTEKIMAVHVEEPTPEHLGGHEWNCHVDPGILTWLYERLSIRSMLDVGCGTGAMVTLARTMGLRALGVDGDQYVCRSHPHVVCHDFTEGPLDLGSYDLAWSVEFLEHVAEEHQEHYMATFRRCRYAFVTAAPPGRGGHHHVNCRPADYWIDVFGRHGFEYLEAETAELQEASRPRLHRVDGGQAPSQAFALSAMLFRRTDG